MTPAPYLLRVISRPVKVTNEEWTKWYLEEHLPDLINTGTTKTAALYSAFEDFPLSTKTPAKSEKTTLGGRQIAHTDIEIPSEKRFLALYQTEFPRPTHTEEYKKVRTESDIFPGKKSDEVADFDIRVYKLIQNFDPKNLGEVASPYVLNVQVEPVDDEDYHTFYREEHLMMLSRVPGYRRSQRFELIEAEANAPTNAPRFMAVHEFENLDSTDGQELREADASPNTIRVFGNAHMVNIRGFKLIKGFGFDNSE